MTSTFPAIMIGEQQVNVVKTFQNAGLVKGGADAMTCLKALNGEERESLVRSIEKEQPEAIAFR